MKNTIISGVCLAILFLFGPLVTHVSAAYKFPWANEVAWEWWTRSPFPTWHDNCVTKCAIDFGTSGNYNEVVAIESGTVSAVCPSATTVDIHINHGGIIFSYFHIDKSTLETNIAASATVVQGQLLGKTRLGSFEEVNSCGGYTDKASQGTSQGHIHLQMPVPATYTFDGWTITYPNPYMANGGVTKNAGDSFTSTNQLTIKGGTINITKTYTSKNEIIIEAPTTINGSSGTIILKTI